MKKIVLPLGVTLVIVTLSGICYKDTQRGIVSIQTGQVARQDLVQVVTASEEIAPRNYVNISANSASRITAATRQAALTDTTNPSFNCPSIKRTCKNGASRLSEEG